VRQAGSNRKPGSRKGGQSSNGNLESRLAGEGFNDDEDEQNQRGDPMRAPFAFTAKDSPQGSKRNGKYKANGFPVNVAKMGRRNQKLAPIKTYHSS
jgi:hypothetical protein